MRLFILFLCAALLCVAVVAFDPRPAPGLAFASHGHGAPAGSDP